MLCLLDAFDPAVLAIEPASVEFSGACGPSEDANLDMRILPLTLEELAAAGGLETVLNAQGVKWIDILKLDVGGCEDTVLAPFFAAAPGLLWPKTIVLERRSSQAGANDCIDATLKLGYRIVIATRNNTVMNRVESAAASNAPRLRRCA